MNPQDKLHKCSEIALLILSRILMFIPVMAIETFGALIHIIRKMKDFIIYGGEEITYSDQINRTTLTDVFMWMKEQRKQAVELEEHPEPPIKPEFNGDMWEIGDNYIDKEINTPHFSDLYDYSKDNETKTTHQSDIIGDKRAFYLDQALSIINQLSSDYQLTALTRLADEYLVVRGYCTLNKISDDTYELGKLLYCLTILGNRSITAHAEPFEIALMNNTFNEYAVMGGDEGVFLFNAIVSVESSFNETGKIETFHIERIRFEYAGHHKENNL